MRHRTLATAAVLFTVLAGSTIARADEHEGGLGGATATTVSKAPGTIAALNYADDGVTVNGLLLTGNNILLLFYKQVCGGYTSLGKVGDQVTYSGVSVTYTSGFETVHVTSYTDGTSISYPPPAPAKPPAYDKGVAGSITQLNYSEWGTINGFFFTASDQTKAFVHIGTPSADLVKALTAATTPPPPQPPPVTVTGTSEPAPQCAQNGVPEVDASAIMIATTNYQVTQKGTPGAFARPR